MPRDEPALGRIEPLPSTLHDQRSRARVAASGPGRLAAAALVVVPVVAAGVVMGVPANLTIPGFAVLTLALFIPVLCALSVVLKRDRFLEREEATVATDHLVSTQYFQLYQRNPLPNIIRQTWFPILVIFLINLYFTRVLIYTPPFEAKDFGNFLLLGHLFPATDDAATAYLRQSFDVMCYAYLGWYVWTVSTIFSRLITMELVAATYYSVLTRLVVAVFVALVFNHLQSVLWSGGQAPLAEAVGFGVGLFPDAALAWLQGWLRRTLLRSDERLEDFPLDLIQGVSPFRKLRLSEMGLDNCENLAAANAVELFLTSNLKLVEVIDWIGQAQLLILVGSDKFMTLQHNGYRTAIDLHRGSRSAACPVLARLLDYDPAQLVDIVTGMEQDPSYCSLIELRGHLNQPLSPEAAPQEALPAQG